MSLTVKDLCIKLSPIAEIDKKSGWIYLKITNDSPEYEEYKPFINQAKNLGFYIQPAML